MALGAGRQRRSVWDVIGGSCKVRRPGFLPFSGMHAGFIALCFMLHTAMCRAEFHVELLEPLLGRPQVLLLGDSLTEWGAQVDLDAVGWAALLTSYLSRQADVLNRGFSGYNSEHIRAMLTPSSEDEFDTQPLSVAGHLNKVVLVILWLGANDAVGPGHPVHVPLPRFVKNLRLILKVLEDGLPRAALIVLTPPPIDEVLLNAQPWYAAAQRTPERTAGYAQAVLQTVKALRRDRPGACEGLTFQAWRETGLLRQAGACILGVDIHGQMLEEAGSPPTRLLSDGLHLSGAGNAFVFSRLRAEFRSSFGWDEIPAAGDRWEARLQIHFPISGQVMPNGSALDCAWPGRASGRHCRG